MTLSDLLALVSKVPALFANVATLRTDLDSLRADFNAERQIVTDFLAQLDTPPVDPPPFPVVVLPVIVPPAPSGDPNDPALFVMPGGDFNDPRVRDAVIEHAAQVTAHRSATPSQFIYWQGVWPGLIARGIELQQPDYVWKKLIGWQSTGADKPQFGPYR